MDPIAGAVAVAPLFIEWFKERRQARQDVDADAFRAWLTEVAFPKILDASQATFEVLSISQKTHHAELLGYLDSQFNDLKVRLEEARSRVAAGVTLADRWGRLGAAAHGLLRQMAEQVRDTDSTYEDAQLTGPFVVPDATEADVVTGRMRAEEAGLLLYSEASSNGQWLRLTACGYLTTIASAAGQDRFDADLERLRTALSRARSGPIDKLVALTHGRCQPAVVFAVLEQWEASGWLSLQRLDQREHSRIMGPAQTLFNADAERLRRSTLRPFLDELGSGSF